MIRHPRKKVGLLSIFSASALAIFALSCGNDDGDSAPPPSSGTAYAPTLVPLGNSDASCKNPQSGGTATQQQQVQTQYQQVKQNSCAPQFQFTSSRLSDFIILLDCDQRVVFIQNKGVVQKSVSLPILEDGSVRGQMQFQQQVQNDGQGRALCWVDYVVTFDGRASCDGSGHVDLATTVDFASTQPTTDALRALHDSDEPGATPLPTSEPTLPEFDPAPAATPAPEETQLPATLPTQSPTSSPSPSPSPSPRPSPSPSHSPSPRPSASPSHRPVPPLPPPPPPPLVPVVITPVEVCVIQNPCPVVGNIDYTCPVQQQ